MASGAIAVFTSGGDAPGMNAVVRSVARMAMHYGREVFVIYEGYQGMVDGGDYIRRFEWKDTSLIIHKGGTIIGSARCSDFRERRGRLKACKNLVMKNITNLVCCGGDGSLTGANLFKLEWGSMVQELRESNEISQEQAENCEYLNIVGCVGSIDNDMVYDGGVTIGTDTALWRIVDAVDAVQSTASSHQRTFVLEIMGRNCGYLAWAAGIATGADFIFIPESPPKRDDWATELCSHLDYRRKQGSRLCTVLVAEGAIDKRGNRITSREVHKVIQERLHHDTRSTILGHVQRGGHASAYDRLLGTVTGAMCVEKLRRARKGDEATIVGIRGFLPVYNNLEKAVARTQAVAAFTKKLDFEGAVTARGFGFKKHVEILKAINRDEPRVPYGHHSKNYAVLCSGAPAAGMNAAIRGMVNYTLNEGHRVFVVHRGFVGLSEGKLEEMEWIRDMSFAGSGGCAIVTERRVPESPKGILETIKKFSLSGILVIGGFDALRAISTFQRDISIPMVLIPATISNNVPGSDYSLGCDTAVNAVVSAIDSCKISADSSNARVFIIETQGKFCSYLALVAATAGGADIVYTHERGVTLQGMLDDIARIKAQIVADQKRHFVVVRNEKCSESYDLRFMQTLFAEEGKGCFSVRVIQLGHLCQGIYPSPFDRVRATLFACRAADYLIHGHSSPRRGESNKKLIGKRNGGTHFGDISDAVADAQWETRTSTHTPWFALLPLQKMLAKHGEIESGSKFDELVDKICSVTDEFDPARLSFRIAKGDDLSQK